MVTIRKIKSTNRVLYDTIRDLKKFSNKTGTMLWKGIGFMLSRTNKNKAQVNISKINKYSSAKERVIVPGKVLGEGTITKPVNVVGFNASQSAIDKIEKAGGTFTKIKDYLKTNPKDKPKILG